MQFLKGVGPPRAAHFARLGVRTLEDLLRHFPREYRDRREVTRIGDLVAEQDATVRARVVRVSQRHIGGRRGRRTVVSAVVDDGSGALDVEFWQRGGVARSLREGGEVILAGRVVWDRGGARMNSPELEVVPEEDPGERLHAECIVPVHPLTKGLFPALVRRLVHRALAECAERVPDPLPATLVAEHGFPPIADALRAIHFPPDDAALELARRRFKYEELFLLEVALALRRLRHAVERKPHRLVVDARLDRRIRARFPFTLTGAQDRVVAEICRDLAREQPMNRLIQGDVGSGKTVVAAYAMLTAVAHGLQAALLAPTEILAEQHHRTLSHFLDGSRVRLGLVAGSARTKRGKAARAAVASGESDIVIGTHALIQESVAFRNLALVVVDEQHRFGVLQRAALRKKGLAPDLMVMSATPIPRTLTMTLFGDLDLSVIDELPPGRQPVDTVLCDEGDRAEAYRWVLHEIAAGRRVYNVVPLVEDSEELPLKSAISHRDELAAGVFAGIGVGLLHGKLKNADKDAAMEAFRDGKTPVLVATSVVEVGMDVPEATVMIVEHAERFGLAQLHQLRGRVGRGDRKSRMLLFHDAKTPGARARLQALCDTHDGFRIAEEDLRIRGPGEFLGTRQHGVPELRIASLVGDGPLLSRAREDAFALVERDPLLEGEGVPVLAALKAQYAARAAGLLA